jgi:hypothetical protein
MAPKDEKPENVFSLLAYRLRKGEKIKPDSELSVDQVIGPDGDFLIPKADIERINKGVYPGRDFISEIVNSSIFEGRQIIEGDHVNELALAGTVNAFYDYPNTYPIGFRFPNPIKGAFWVFFQPKKYEQMQGYAYLSNMFLGALQRVGVFDIITPLDDGEKGLKSTLDRLVAFDKVSRKRADDVCFGERVYFGTRRTMDRLEKFIKD